MSAAVLEILSQFRTRQIAIIQDDLAFPGRAILVSPAIASSPEIINEMITLSGGICFVALSSARANGFLLGQMSRPRTVPVSPRETRDTMDICLSVEAREGVSTGISVADRSMTIRILGDESIQPRKLVHPGHIFPVEVRAGGVLVRNALPEAALDIVTIAGYSDAAHFLDLVDGQGEFMSTENQHALAQNRNIPLLTLSALIQHRLESETLVTRVAEARLPTQRGGELRSVVYRSSIHGGEHIALIKGTIRGDEPVLVRVQTEFTFSDVFGGGSPPTREVIHTALEMMQSESCGVLLYLRRPSEGQLREQIQSWETKMQEKPASMMREYGLGAQILRDLGVRKAKLLSNSPRTLVGLPTFGIEIVDHIPLETRPVNPSTKESQHG